jgi:2'-5' RNA ligase
VNESIRAFIAVGLPASVRHALSAVQMELKAAGIEGRWVPPDNVHLTLKFLGGVSTGEIGPIASCLDRAVGRCAGFPLAARGVGVFPGARKARVLWVGVEDPSEALPALHRGIERELTRRGYPADDRPFRAHLTLARFKRPPARRVLSVGLEGMRSFASGFFTVDSIGLFSSKLGPEGARYRLLHAAGMPTAGGS